METFSALLALCAGNSPVPVNPPHKGQWRGALMFPLIYAWINDWVNNREAGDLRRQRGHYDVIVMRADRTNILLHVLHILLNTIWVNSVWMHVTKMNQILSTGKENQLCWKTDTFSMVPECRVNAIIASDTATNASFFRGRWNLTMHLKSVSLNNIASTR